MSQRGVFAAALLGCLAWIAPVDAQAPNRDHGASLGITVEPAQGRPEGGVMVRQVMPDGPAAKAGMEKGDIILKVDNKEATDFETVVNALAAHKPGDKIPLEVRRGEQTKKFSVTLGERRPIQDNQARGEPREPATPFLGVQTRELTPEMRDQFGVTVEKGAVVMDVVPNSPAARAGLRRDDVITRFNGQDIATPRQLRDAVQQAGINKKANLEAIRGKEKKEFSAQLEQAPANFFYGGPRPIPFPDVNPGGELPGPGSILQDHRKVQDLERQIRDLEKRVQELEKKQKAK
jgi:S1-C subfamily serine protease